MGSGAGSTSTNTIPGRDTTLSRTLNLTSPDISEVCSTMTTSATSPLPMPTEKQIESDSELNQDSQSGVDGELTGTWDTQCPLSSIFSRTRTITTLTFSTALSCTTSMIF